MSSGEADDLGMFDDVSAVSQSAQRGAQLEVFRGLSCRGLPAGGRERSWRGSRLC